jgi:uracil phosphoribosyltransferase
MRYTLARDGISMPNVTTIEHPLIQHKLTLMRDKRTPTIVFRQLTREIATLLCYEVTRDLELDSVDIETPLKAMQARKLAGKKLVFAPVLRAGMGFLEGMLDLVPSARVAHVGLYRDPITLNAVEYYFRSPADVSARLVIAVDPMLATGNTAVAAVERLKAHGAGQIRFVCLLATHVGIANLHKHHPDVRVWTAAIDPELNDHGYIVPGLGDAGDRIYGTR